MICTWLLEFTHSISPDAVPVAPDVAINMTKLVRVFRVGVHQWTGRTAFSFVSTAALHLASSLSGVTSSWRERWITSSLDGSARAWLLLDPNLTFWPRNNGREELDKHDGNQKIHRLGNLLISVCTCSDCFIFSSVFHIYTIS